MKSIAKTSQKTIVEFFARQNLNNQQSVQVECPVCGRKVSENVINYHLDNQCHVVIPAKKGHASGNQSIAGGGAAALGKLKNNKKKLTRSIKRSASDSEEEEQRTNDSDERYSTSGPPKVGTTRRNRLSLSRSKGRKDDPSLAAEPCNNNSDAATHTAKGDTKRDKSVSPVRTPAPKSGILPTLTSNTGSSNDETELSSDDSDPDFIYPSSSKTVVTTPRHRKGVGSSGAINSSAKKKLLPVIHKHIRSHQNANLLGYPNVNVTDPGNKYDLVVDETKYAAKQDGLPIPGSSSGHTVSVTCGDSINADLVLSKTKDASKQVGFPFPGSSSGLKYRFLSTLISDTESSNDKVKSSSDDTDSDFVYDSSSKTSKTTQKRRKRFESKSTQITPNKNMFPSIRFDTDVNQSDDRNRSGPSSDPNNNVDNSKVVKILFATERIESPFPKSNLASKDGILATRNGDTERANDKIKPFSDDSDSDFVCAGSSKASGSTPKIRKRFLSKSSKFMTNRNLSPSIRKRICLDTNVYPSDDGNLNSSSLDQPNVDGNLRIVKTMGMSERVGSPLPKSASALKSRTIATHNGDTESSTDDSDFVSSKIVRKSPKNRKRAGSVAAQLATNKNTSPGIIHKRIRLEEDVDPSDCVITDGSKKPTPGFGVLEGGHSSSSHDAPPNAKPSLRQQPSCEEISGQVVSTSTDDGCHNSEFRSLTLSQQVPMTPTKYHSRGGHAVKPVTPDSQAKAAKIKQLKSVKTKLRLSKKYDSGLDVADAAVGFSTPTKSQTVHLDPVQLSPRSKAFIRKIPLCFDYLKRSVCANRASIQSDHRFVAESSVKSPVREKHNEAISVDEQDLQTQESEHIPYFLRNFLDILQRVLNEKDDLMLFNDDDLAVMKSFYLLTAQGQELYVRLFTRKHKWLLGEKISYPEIMSNLTPTLAELCGTGFLENGENLNDLKTLLDILPAPQVKKLSKFLNLKAVAKKEEAVSQIMVQCKTQPTVFFGRKENSSTQQIIINKAKEFLDRVYRLLDKPRRIFVRVMMLFSLTQYVDDSRQDDQPIQMVTLLMVNLGKLVFPPFQVLRQARIFRNRDDLIRYETAHSLEADILLAIEAKDWDTATMLCTTACENHSDLVSQADIIRHDTSLPSFLKKFTAGHLFTRCLSHRVDLLQRLKRYNDAVAQLDELLQQDNYCQSYRGHWTERLALNCDQHLKNPTKALEIIFCGLEDLRITTDHKLCLYIRLQKILKSKNNKDILEDFSQDIPSIEIPKAPEVYCQGRLVPFSVSGRKTAFELDVPSKSGNGGDVQICSVEEVALDYYIQLGYTDGVHGEGAALVTIFGLIFWDIIYKSGIPDAFRSIYQGTPLDLVTSDFYSNRKDEIDERLEIIRKATLEELADRVEQCWVAHENQTSLVSWNLYGSYTRVQALIMCIGMKHLADICERFCHNYRHYRSGVPDLTIWNSETLEWKMIEVKGPGDRLSHKQMEWLEYFRSIGVPAEVCHVKATAAKRLKKLSKEASPKKNT